ncbi:MAG: 16S rRNA (cytosine(1402)-N(4))-methyltransferase RsmH [Acidiferrobacterales bacterium]|nr:16S rRNA (cytosine(1402)-N(4))-methyltransferase RsmH [Acidiferrobacterales bacterium]
MQTHRAVLVDEVIEALKVRADGVYVDATCGPGGHAVEILRRLGPHGRLLAFDRDAQAVAFAQSRFAADSRVTVRKAPFSTLGTCINSEGLDGQVSGILFDLGISSVQLDDHQRGFSFQQPGPLDMRMDREHGMSAAEWLNKASEREIALVLKELGEERFARRIARTIVRERKQNPIATTVQLAQLVSQAVPTRERNKHPATRTFLALRLIVNTELDELRSALPQALQALAPGGRLVVVSFHSLEDRVVKQFMRGQVREKLALVDGTTPASPALRSIGKIVRPSATEIRRNPRARSAVMRVAERTVTGCA